ncbi:adenylate kinase, partial [Nowakowskiella sp. JEL0078]
MISLEIKDEDLIHRQSLQLMDPLTGIVYPGNQISFSQNEVFRLKNAEVETESMEEENEEENQESEENDEENDEVEDNDEENNKMKKHQKDSSKAEEILERLKYKNKWTVIGSDIVSRLVKRPDDTREQATFQVKLWNTWKSQLLEKLKQSTFDNLHYISLDATQHPETIFDNLNERIDAFGCAHIPSKFPKKLPSPDAGLSESDIQNFLSSVNLDLGEPKRDISNWGKFCPVIFYESKELVESGYFNVAAYKTQVLIKLKGHLYFLSSEPKLIKFCNNPDRYLGKTPYVPKLNLSIHGGPFSGKTLQAKLLSKIYRLKYISVDSIILQWDTIKDQTELQKSNSLYSKIVKKCRAGKELTGDMLVEIIKSVIGVKESKLETKGWVLDGFPRTLEQAKALVEAGFGPQYAIVLQNALSKSLEQYPYFDNLYNGYREEFLETIQYLEDSESTCINISAGNQPETVLSAIQFAIDPFIPKAVSIPAAKNEDPAPPEWGFTKNYCPVALKRRNILVKGQKGILARYMSKYYFLSSEEARTNFINEPHNFVTNRMPMKPPPPRIVFIGVPGSGKTTAIELLKEYSVPYVEFDTFLHNFAKTQLDEQRDELEYMIKEGTGIMSPPLIVEALMCLFTMEPYASQGFFLENFPKNKLEIETMLKDEFSVDAFVIMRTDSEVVAQRQIRAIHHGKVSAKISKKIQENEDMSEDELMDTFLD